MWAVLHGVQLAVMQCGAILLIGATSAVLVRHATKLVTEIHATSW